MRKLQLNIHDSDGNVVYENILEIGNRDKIIVKFKRKATQQEYNRSAEVVSKWLFSGNPVLTLPDDVELMVLRITGDEDA